MIVCVRGCVCACLQAVTKHSKPWPLQAHRQLAKVHHPDKVAGLEPESVEQAKQQMQRLNWAKERMLEKLESSWVPTRRRKGTPTGGRD